MTSRAETMTQIMVNKGEEADDDDSNLTSQI